MGAGFSLGRCTLFGQGESESVRKLAQIMFSFSYTTVRTVPTYNAVFSPLIAADPEGPGLAALVLTFLSIVLIAITMPFSLCLVIKVSYVVVQYLRLCDSIVYPYRRYCCYRYHLATLAIYV